MSIRLDMPRELDLVGSPVMIGGIATGFEATITIASTTATTRSRASSPPAATPSSRSCAPTRTASTTPT